MRAAWICMTIALLALPGAAGELGTDSERAEGKELYDKYCAQCHGVNGDGEGYATSRVKPRPRDFTAGKYKFRTTPSGMLPTDDDLFRVIRDGLPYTSMPGWPMFSDQQTRNIIYHLKTFSDKFQDPELEAAAIEIPEPPPSTPESVERGRAVFETQGCAACHGELGRGDGTSGPTLTDDWGNHLQAVDMTMRWTFRGGPTRKDIFQTFSTGVNGTPMPSYAETLEVSDRWDLVDYIFSLGESDTPDYSNLLMVPYVEDEIDVGAESTSFDTAPRSRFPLVGQIIEPGRNFYPSATSIVVRAVHNRREIAFRLEWHDMRAETDGTNGPSLETLPWDEDQPGQAEDDIWGGELEEEEDPFAGFEEEEDDADFWGEEEDTGGSGDGEFSDAVALQFPAQMPSGIRRPYFIFGDLENPVDLWFVDMARANIVQQFVGRGSDSLTPSDTDELEIVSSYDRGLWTVTIKRPMRSTSTITFAEDQYVPLAFSIWDAFNRERGNKRALSAWFHLYVEPSQELSPVGPMLRAAGLALVIEILLVAFLRRFSRTRAEAAEAA